MRKYIVKTVEEPAEIRDTERLFVDEFTHGTSGYEPRTNARLVYVRDRGFLCRMESEETSLRAEVTMPDGPTHLDSCLEFFVNFAPEKKAEYLNLETNPLGTLHCKFGPGRAGRKPLAECGCETRPQIHVLDAEDCWGVDFFIPLETVRALYGKSEFRKGDVLRGNFYKCGDDTAHPHYGVWNRVETETPDFHRPEFFGELVIG